MTSTPPDAPVGPPADGPAGSPDDRSDDRSDDRGPRVTRGEVRDLGRLRRSASDRKVAGVAGGIGRHLDIDPLVLRVTFVVLAFFGGAGLLLYGACWLFVPDEETGDAPVPLDERSRTVALAVVGVLATFALVGDSWGFIWFPWPLAIIAVVALVLMNRRGRSPVPAAPSQTTAGASGPTAPQPSWTPPAVAPNPRRRGPILFWFTLALVALGIGILGMVDVGGVAVPDSAYPAVALGLTGVMLLVGSVYGRAGGLVPLGLVIAVVLAATTVTSHWDGTITSATPTTAAAVDSSYEFDGGELVLDLTEVEDLENLDGRSLRLEGGMGRIELVVPADLDVAVDARVGGPGEVEVFGERDDGIDSTVVLSHDGGPGAPSISIDADLGVGEIDVTTK